MPKIERIIWLRWNGVNHPFVNCEPSDARAIRKAIRELECKEGMMTGGLVKYFRDNADEIVVMMK
jgi:hypothetical protein